MGTAFEDLRILQVAEEIADQIWQQVAEWDSFAREVVGGQLARAADSVGANIAESFGRFHYGEKLQFLYYARGSLFETKYWLNRTMKRQLMATDQVKGYAVQLTQLARQLNAFAASVKAQRRTGATQSKSLRERSVDYSTITIYFYLATMTLTGSKPSRAISNLQSLISTCAAVPNLYCFRRLL